MDADSTLETIVVAEVAHISLIAPDWCQHLFRQLHATGGVDLARSVYGGGGADSASVATHLVPTDAESPGLLVLWCGACFGQWCLACIPFHPTDLTQLED